MPPILREQLSGQSPLTANQIQRFQAVVLRIRIDGLAAEEVQNSIIGNKPSIVTALFNTFYTPLLSALHEAKIPLAEVSMNRVTAIVPLEGVAQAGRVLQALTGVEKAIEATLGKAPPGYPHISWQVTAGVGVGSVASVVIASEALQRSVYIFGGAAIDQADHALILAKEGQVVAHRDVLKRLGSAPNGKWVDANFFLPEGKFADNQVGEVLARGQAKRGTGNLTPISNPPFAYEPFIDPILRTGTPFQAVQEGIITEHFACLLLRIKGLVLNTDESVSRWTTVLENVLDIAARYGALVDRVSVDADQAEIRLAFGLPHIQEQAGRNAAGCALALQRALGNIEPGLHMAIAGGTGFAALLGSDNYSPYVIISPALITTAQLASTADARDIVADEVIQQATEKIFGWRSITGSRAGLLETGFVMTGEISLGGGLSTRYQVARQIPLVGREKERDQLRYEAQRGLSSANHLLLVTGEGGSGRSALIDELVGQWLAAGGSGFISIGPSYVPTAPYSLWIPVWQFLFGLIPEEEPARNLEKLQLSLLRMLPDAEAAVAIFEDILGLVTTPSPLVEGLKAETRQERLFDATLYLLRQFAELSPLLLVFEYLDNSDTLSLELLRKIAAALDVYPVLLCLEDRASTAHSLATYFSTPTTIAARSLSGQDAWRLLNHLLPDVPWPVHFRAAFAEFLNIYDPAHGEGSSDSKITHLPANMIALATALEFGILKRRGGQWDFENTPPPQEWPRDWHEITNYLVEQVLGSREGQVMFHAASDGMTFYNHALWIKKFAHPALVELNRMRELRLSERYIDEGAARRWDRFRHQSVREALYSHLDATERLAVHQQIAIWEALRSPGHAGKALVAYHSEHAGEIDKAVDAYLEASQFAAGWGATSEAMQSVLAAERLLARQETEASPAVSLKVRLAWADLYLRQNNLEKAIHEINRAVEYAEAAGQLAPLANSLIIRARSQIGQHNYAIVSADASRVVDLLQNDIQSEMLAEAKWLQARALYANQQASSAIRILTRAVDAKASLNPRLEIEMRLDAVHYLLADYQRDRAYPHVQQAYQQAKKLGDPLLLHQATAQLGRMKVLYGEAEEALEFLERALQLTAPLETNRTTGHVYQDHAIGLCFLGRYSDAQASFDSAGEFFTTQNATTALAYFGLIRAHELYIDHHEFDQAEAALHDFETQSAASDDLSLLADVIRVNLQLQRKEFEEARQLLEKLDAQPLNSGHLWYRPAIGLHQAELAILQSDLDRADQQLHRALGAVGAQGDLRYLTAIYTLLAEVKILREESHESIQDALDRAETCGRRQGRRIHLARALLLSGQYLKHTSHRYSTRARASTFLFEADLLYKEMGLPMPDQIAGYAG